MDKKNKFSSERKRLTFSSIWAVVTNSFLYGFLQGKIYTGKLKNLCVPGLNCYSCPGALGSCPLGALQNALGSRENKFSFYVVGFFIFAGAVFGRFICGWLCPFGLIQDLLHKIPFPKKLKTFRFDKYLRKLKYVILLVFVIILPMCIIDISGLGSPWFCKYICPAGMLEGGIPLTLLNKGLRQGIGFLYAWKFVILAVVIFFSVIIYRPFCKYICPLGGIYSLFNKVSIFKIRFDESKCVSCKKCSKACKMNVDPTENPDSLECIRCGLCVQICPTEALTANFAKGCKTECNNDKKEENKK